MISRPTLAVLGLLVVLALIARGTGLLEADLFAPVLGGAVIIVLLLTVAGARDASDL